jgi:transcriptional regulator GlxA family with amidase domain
MNKSRLCGVTDWAKRAHAANYKVSVLAKNCEVSVSSLERFFRSKVGKTPYEWMRDLRQMKNLEQLYGSTKSIKEIAFANGYKQVSHFTRQFAKIHGMPPTELRSARQDASEAFARPS